MRVSMYFLHLELTFTRYIIMDKGLLSLPCHNMHIYNSTCILHVHYICICLCNKCKARSCQWIHVGGSTAQLGLWSQASPHPTSHESTSPLREKIVAVFTPLKRSRRSWHSAEASKMSKVTLVFRTKLFIRTIDQGEVEFVIQRFDHSLVVFIRYHDFLQTYYSSFVQVVTIIEQLI